jgi:uroporphyrin-III C-methyltransferase / precorrin-2 dehydrogenase / sirohydrochlorin ferrochelatase
MAARAWRERFSGLDLRRRRAIWTEFSARALSSGDRAPTEADYAALDNGARAGRLVLVGVGPGDRDLLTLRALRALQAADLIVEDGAIHPDIRDLGRREAAIEVFREGVDPIAQSRLLARVGEGAAVVVLRPGDGRSADWARAAASAGVTCEWAPGLPG